MDRPRGVQVFIVAGVGGGSLLTGKVHGVF
jgi:hypothetical protein